MKHDTEQNTVLYQQEHDYHNNAIAYCRLASRASFPRLHRCNTTLSRKALAPRRSSRLTFPLRARETFPHDVVHVRMTVVHIAFSSWSYSSP